MRHRTGGRKLSSAKESGYLAATGGAGILPGEGEHKILGLN